MEVGGRRLARQVALQWLYQRDAQGDTPDGWTSICEDARLTPDDIVFARSLANGMIAHRDEIDRLLVEVAEHWSISRMAVVDRNALRLGAYEMLHSADTPPRVALNEAIQLAKCFGGEKSGAFVNGILDRLLLRAETARVDMSKSPEVVAETEGFFR